MPKRLILHQFNVLNLNGTHDGKASRIVVVSTPTQSALFQQPKDSSLLDNGTEEDTNATFIMNNDGADNDKKRHDGRYLPRRRRRRS